MQRFNRFLIWLWSQEGSPGERARGIAFGVFAGCFPLFGLQTILGIALASLFKGNRVLAGVGTWISNPITYIPLYLFNYEIGCWILGGKTENIVFRELTWDNIIGNSSILTIRVLIGSFIVGLGASLISGLLAFKYLQRKNSFRR